ncbi:phosphoenolpyruvate synthase [Candidatus Microgenomates bacterium]|nr:MAG: phosphoenolpyruvate synthase [Candidatus Microgenomates bacterium]
MVNKSDLVVWFSEIDKGDVALVGGKGANLGEMCKAKFPVPNGFIVTSSAYYEFLRLNNLSTKIKHLISTANFEKTDSVQQVSNLCKKEIMQGKISDELVKKIFTYYEKLGGVLKDALVSVRSSATAEDLPGASFAGQQETFLNVRGEANLILKIKQAWASLFDARAIFYRHEKKYDHFRVGIAIPVQKMIESEESGVMFTLDPITNDKSKIIIEAIYGLGEYIVQGKVTPDHYEVSKDEFKILNKTISVQDVQYKKVGNLNKSVTLSKKEGGKQKITDAQIIEIAKIGKNLEKHYYFPQDIEWAIEKNKIYIVQTRPVTTIDQKQKPKSEKEESFNSQLSTLNSPIVKGSPASPGIASGPARIIKSANEINKVLAGEVLVAPQTNPDYVPAMKKSVAIVTDFGGRTSHAAIVSRELGVPAVVGTTNATKLIKEGSIITVDGTKGEIYKGGFQAANPIDKRTPLAKRIKTATKVYVNLAQPDLADKIAQRHVDGIGLIRAEFMMAGIGTHPKKLIREGKKHVFVDKLAEGLDMFAKAFYPRPVVYRTSDFKTNEYRGLIGGKEFEPEEPNPMLGFRGVYRYINDPEVFELELEAIKKVRNKHNHKNLSLMLPFVRTVKELTDVKKIISTANLHQSPSFKIWMMVEIPSNVVLLEKFIEAGIDGVSIGSNDLTMLMLGTDRDNSEVASEFDEQNEAVLWALERVIKTAKKHGITSSICGQAPSLYPSLLEKLVKWGITSVSIAPDVIESVRESISNIEKNLVA